MSYFTRKGAGVCRYNGETFQSFTTKDGLASDAVIAIHEDNQGYLWFGTNDGGVSKFDGKIFRNYTTADGLPSNSVGAITQDMDGNFWFGHGLKGYDGGRFGATQYNGDIFRTFTVEDGLVNDSVRSVITDVQGNIWFGTLGGVSRYDGESFQNFTTAEGLGGNDVNDLFQARNGDIWFGTGHGVSKYDGKSFQKFTAKDGLAHNWVASVTEDREGSLWFGTHNNGASRYDESIQNIPAEVVINHAISDGSGNLWFAVPGAVCKYDGEKLYTFKLGFVFGIYEDSQGNIWVGTWGGGLARYDGEEFRVFTTKDGLSHNTVLSICESSAGLLWIGTWGGGICAYDGERFVQMAGKKELGEGWDWISCIIEDSKGNMWFSMPNYGIGKYDDEKFIKFSPADGLSGHVIFELTEDREGNIWASTQDGGASRYDGESFRAFTTKDGLAENDVHGIYEDSKGNLWFRVATGGVHKYDGRNFQVFTTDDGLPSNFSWKILEDEAGSIIFFTSRGIATYTPPDEQIPPPVFVTEVVADKIYRDPKELTIPSTTPRISFSYYGASFKTKRMRYNYMLEGHDADWQATWDEEVSYEDLEPGDYVFKVIAINRDLVYSESPVIVDLTVVAPFYMRAVFLVPTIGSGAILLAAMVILATALTRRRRQVHAYQQAAVQELQDAREMQMSLMPDSAPPVEGFQIAGSSHPAREVGGDFFDYISLPDGRVGAALVDVSGKGLKGAMNAVLTNGMLHEVMTIETSCGKILSRLNADLYPVMEKYMFTTLGLAILTPGGNTLAWSNAAQPYPIVKRGDEILEFEGELPLAMMPDVIYPDLELELQAGDVVIFYTDGIIEAENEAEEMYGTERLEKMVADMDSTMSAEGIIEAILQDVTGFTGTAEQYDDMTVVVAKKIWFTMLILKRWFGRDEAKRQVVWIPVFTGMTECTTCG